MSANIVGPVFLSLDEVLEIHDQQIERYGGSHGLRDAAGLESAVATPQATFGGEFLHTSIPGSSVAQECSVNRCFWAAFAFIGTNVPSSFGASTGPVWPSDLHPTNGPEIAVRWGRCLRAARCAGSGSWVPRPKISPAMSRTVCSRRRRFVSNQDDW